MNSATTVYVLCSPQPNTDETCLQTLVQFLGLQVRVLKEPPEDAATPETAVHIAATSQSLNAFQRQPVGQAWLSKSLARKGSSLFVTCITQSPDCLLTLAKLVPGVVDSVTPVATQSLAYEIAPISSTGMPQFKGLRFGTVDREADGVFALSSGAAAVTELITIDGRPCYIKVEHGGASYFLLACARVLDIDAPPERAQPIDRFLQFVPFLAYLRLTFGALCWHNEAPAACFIIDDPLLRERYGFLDFNRIESQMARTRFSMNIAFIPWNCRRSNLHVAERFKRPDRRFSISIHGCDHTDAEFGATDERWLKYQSRRALARMDVHAALTGIRHNRVMVFPQGAFSKASLKVLADEGFLAAVNSTIYPVDARPGDVTFRDLLEVAVMRFGGTPLFLRQYPDRLEKVALDVFLGRQVLLVEHHAYFKRGFEEAERLTAFVNEISPAITWTDLEEVCTSACHMREVPGDGVHVRAFGSILRLRNRRGNRIRFRVSNLWEQGDLETVTWNGRSIAFEAQPAGVVCDVLLDSREEGMLCFHRAQKRSSLQIPTPRATERLRVFARRHLCEFRDNYLDRSAILSQLARRGKNFLS